MSIIDKSIQKLEQSQKSKAEQETNTEIQAQASAEVEPQKVEPQKADSLAKEQPVANLDFVALEEQGFLSSYSGKSVLSEEFRGLKRKVINNAFGALSSTLTASNLIMVTSCSPGEGKTYNSINLALSIAQEKDKTVLLVDADVLRPSIASHLGLSPENGLTDYLNGKVESLQDVMLTTSIEKLKILPAGNLYSLSSELLASDKMKELTEEFASRYKDRIVIFDAPPMLGINETALLAELVGQVLIVVEEDKTHLGDIQELLSLLPEECAKGFIVNKCIKPKKVGYGYGY